MLCYILNKIDKMDNLEIVNRANLMDIKGLGILKVEEYICIQNIEIEYCIWII